MVGGRIDDGRRLIDALARGGLDITAAAWVRPHEDERWTLYIVSKDVDSKGPLIAYRAVADALRSIHDTLLSMTEIKLVGGADTVGRNLLEVFQGNIGRLTSRQRRPVIGGMPVDEAYIYQTGKRPHTELNEEENRLLESIYARSSLAVDDLPYTEEMEMIHTEFVQQSGLAMTTRDVFKALKNLGRQARLGGKHRSQPQPDGGLPVTPPATG